MTENTPLKDLAESVKVPAELVKAVGEPPAQELGQGLADLVYLIFSPVKKWRASTEANVEKYKTEIAKELDKIEPEKRTEPKLSIAGPALEASKYYIEEDELRSMFAKLIAASANSDYKESTLPAFTEIIKQLSAFDAQNLKELKKIDNSPQLNVAGKIRFKNTADSLGNTLIENYIPLEGFNSKKSDVYSASIDNLLRLGLIFINHGYSYKEKEWHESLYQLELYKDLESQLTDLQTKKGIHKDREIKIMNASWNFTEFGRFFIKCCLD